MKIIKGEKGSVTAIVLFTVLFIIVVLSSFFIINSRKRIYQLESQSDLQKIYNSSVNVNELN